MTILRDPKRRPPPIHPGEFLREEFMAPVSLSTSALAIALRVPATRVSEIVNERRGISTDTAVRLGLYFGTSTDFWVRMQCAYDITVAEKESMSKLRKEIQPRPKEDQHQRVA